VIRENLETAFPAC